MLAAAGLAFAVPAVASAAPAAAQHGARFKVRVILNGAKLWHTFIPAGSSKPKTEPLADPDDITVLGHHLFSGSGTRSAHKARQAPMAHRQHDC